MSNSVFWIYHNVLIDNLRSQYIEHTLKIMTFMKLSYICHFFLNFIRNIKVVFMFLNIFRYEFKSSLEAMHIVEVKINKGMLWSWIHFSHFRRAVCICPYKTCFAFKAQILFDYFTKAKIYKNILLKCGGISYILKLNIHVDNMARMQIK
jgi:hypothetical protein